MKRTLGQEPFIVQLVTLLATDSVGENEPSPFSARTCAVLMAIAGVGGLLYGTISGVVPW